MSIWKKPEEAVSVLLARLDKAKEDSNCLRATATEDGLLSKFKGIEEELEGMKDLYPSIKRWEKRVTDQFCALEQELDDDIFKDPEMRNEVHQKLDLIHHDIEELKDLISMVDTGVTDKLRTMSFRPRHDDDYVMSDETVFSQEWVDLGIEEKIFDSKGMSSLLASFHCLESSQVKMCLLCLSIFPENSVIKKKSLIYWWMGEGIVSRNTNQTAEEVGEQVFRQLLNQGFIKPSRENRTLNQTSNEVGELVFEQLLNQGFIKPTGQSRSLMSVNSFMVYPWVRRMLILAAEENGFLKFFNRQRPCNGERRAFLWQQVDSYSMANGDREEDLLTVFNVMEQYLGTRAEWLAKLRKVEVLQLGRWQNSVTHHIEVENQALLNGLGSQKHLKYLSLRGISRIETLPPTITGLISLKILDLRACHNLEKLPLGISAMKNLTHLDVSECYLLESMPKGLEHLLHLQVLKGFVIGKEDRHSCKIGDLERLRSLRKLSIRVSNQREAYQKDQLPRLSSLSDLIRNLTISWGGVSSPGVEDLISLPQSLRKLGLRCFPLEAVPNWMWPSRLPNLDKLYISGGNLGSLEHQDSRNWTVKILRLEHLTNFGIDYGSLFPQLLYSNKVHIQIQQA